MATQPAIPVGLSQDPQAQTEYFDAINKAIQSLEARNQGVNMFNVASAFLTPGRTGSFGEALGNVAGVVGRERQAQQEAEIPLAQMRAQLASQKYQVRQEGEAMQALASHFGVPAAQVEQDLQSGNIDPNQLKSMSPQLYAFIATKSPKLGEIVKNMAGMTTEAGKLRVQQGELDIKTRKQQIDETEAFNKYATEMRSFQTFLADNGLTEEEALRKGIVPPQKPAALVKPAAAPPAAAPAEVVPPAAAPAVSQAPEAAGKAPSQDTDEYWSNLTPDWQIKDFAEKIKKGESKLEDLSENKLLLARVQNELGVPNAPPVAPSAPPSAPQSDTSAQNLKILQARMADKQKKLDLALKANDIPAADLLNKDIQFIDSEMKRVRSTGAPIKPAAPAATTTAAAEPRIPSASEREISKERQLQRDKEFLPKREALLLSDPQTTGKTNEDLREIVGILNVPRTAEIVGLMQSQGIIAGLAAAAEEGFSTPAGSAKFDASKFLSKYSIPAQYQTDVSRLTNLLARQFFEDAKVNKAAVGPQVSNADIVLLRTPMATIGDSKEALVYWAKEKMIMNKQREEMYKAFNQYEQNNPKAPLYGFFRSPEYDSIMKRFQPLYRELVDKHSPIFTRPK